MELRSAKRRRLEQAEAASTVPHAPFPLFELPDVALEYIASLLDTATLCDIRSSCRRGRALANAATLAAQVRCCSGNAPYYAVKLCVVLSTMLFAMPTARPSPCRAGTDAISILPLVVHPP